MILYAAVVVAAFGVAFAAYRLAQIEVPWLTTAYCSRDGIAAAWYQCDTTDTRTAVATDMVGNLALLALVFLIAFLNGLGRKAHDDECTDVRSADETLP